MFKEYVGKPQVREAMMIEDGEALEQLDEKTWKYAPSPEVVIMFNAHQTPVVGDYIVRRTPTDVYLVDGQTFSEISELNEDDLEAEIQAKGLTEPRIEQAQIDKLMAKVEFRANVQVGINTVVGAYLPIGDKMFCLATVSCAPVSPANFDADVGFKAAVQKATHEARENLWQLEGYMLAWQTYYQDYTRNALATALTAQAAQDNPDEITQLHDRETKIHQSIAVPSDILAKPEGE
ncbi:Gp49 family protein [Pseudoalteromonas rubra]|uniref:Gp49 family protein n=1 Tax=Pseudoalteromonas rubra TaxID=43658 RepID=UPI002DB89ED5|nr:Gp49 family protein [Pseudoalteromonas rubra]MEC4091608.1 Gp49 family protein [Pseudoalteromonas rubra]